MITSNSNIAIFRKGESTRQPVIFVHGFPFDHHMWDKTTDVLSDKYHCISFDIRGLGSSDPGDGQYTIEMFADDLFYVMEETKIKSPVLCGFSMGGYISLRAVQRNEPRFKALILCDTKSEADNNQGKLKRAQGISVINGKGLEAFLKEFIPGCFAEESLTQRKKEYDEVFARSMKNTPAGVKGCLLAMAGRTDTSEYLRSIKIPVLAVCGEKDQLTPPAVMENMARQIPGSRFTLIPGAGHMTPVEQPEKFISEISSFLETLK